MTADEKASILYDYIVSGDSMESIADYNGINNSEVSAIIRSYGFNYIKQGSYRSGQHRGAYKNGFRYHYTVNNQRYTDTYYVSKDDVLDFVEQHPWATRDQPCDDGEFENFLTKRALSEAQERHQAEYEQQRRAAENRRREAERQRQIAEENRRREAERQRQIAEENRRRQEEYNRQCFNNLYNEGVTLYEKQQYNSALDKFRQAERIGSSDMLNVYIAYTLNQFSNRNTYAIASEISDRMKKRLSTVGYNPSYNDYHILADALLALGDNRNACHNYFYAGDIAYDKDDFVLADKFYTEGLKKTGFFSGMTNDAPFRIAFAKGRTNNLTNADYEDIIYWYRESLKNAACRATSYGNMAWAYIMLGRYEEAVEAAKDAISLGKKDEYVYRHLVNAYFKLKDYNEIINVSNQMMALGYKPDYFKLGYSYKELGDYDAAEAAYKESIRLENEPSACWNLAILYDKRKLYSVATEYAELAIQKFPQEPRDNLGAAALEIAKLANDTAAYNRMLQNLPKERERLEQERREQERLKQERREQERLEQERREQERLEQERREQKRLEQERREQERLEQERREQERLEKERLELERQKKAALRRRLDDEMVLLF